LTSGYPSWSIEGIGYGGIILNKGKVANNASRP
jgi:hypothetical protein